MKNKKLVYQVVSIFIRKAFLLALFLIATATHVLAHDSEPRDFIIMKTPYRHLMASPLPTTPDGDVDIEKLFVETSMTTKPSLTPEMEWYLSGVILALKEEDIFSAEQHIKGFIKSTKNNRVPMDINSVIQWVLRQSYLENNKELSYYASKVKYFNDIKKSIRETADEARRLLEGAAGCGSGEITSETTMPGTDCGPDDVCCDMEGFISLLDARFQAVVVDERIAEASWLTVLTQMILDRQNQNQQILSSIAKLMFDAQMNIIRKIVDDDD